MSDELFSIFYCKSCNKIEVTQYISQEQMEEFGFTAEELKPICPVTGASDLEEVGLMTDRELRHFSFSDVEGIKKYISHRDQAIPKL